VNEGHGPEAGAGGCAGAGLTKGRLGCPQEDPQQLPRWRKSQSGFSGFHRPGAPIGRRLGRPNYHPMAVAGDFLGTPDGREELVSYRWAERFLPLLTEAADRRLKAAVKNWQQAFKRGEVDPHGRLSSGPSGALLTYARWQSRTEAATDLTNGTWNPERSLTPPGPEPLRFIDPEGAASAVFAAAGQIDAIKSMALDYPNLKCSPFPEAFEARVAEAVSRCKADLKLVQGILSSLAVSREWGFLLDFDPDTVEINLREVNRMFWDCSTQAKEAALVADGHRKRVVEDSSWSGAGDPSMGLGDLAPRGSWIRSGVCWWEGIEALEREHNWQRACRQRDELQAQIDALVDDPALPTPVRQQNLSNKLTKEKQLRLREREIETLAAEMLAENGEVNGTDKD